MILTPEFVSKLQLVDIGEVGLTLIGMDKDNPAKLVRVIPPTSTATSIIILASLDALRAVESNALQDIVSRKVLFGSVETGDLSVTEWVLIEGTHVDDGESYVRPDDYDETTNARIWVRIG